MSSFTPYPEIFFSAERVLRGVRPFGASGSYILILDGLDLDREKGERKRIESVSI